MFIGFLSLPLNFRLLVFNLLMSILTIVTNDWLISFLCEEFLAFDFVCSASNAWCSEINSLLIHYLWLFERLQLIYFESRNAAPSGTRRSRTAAESLWNIFRNRKTCEADSTSYHKSNQVVFFECFRASWSSPGPHIISKDVLWAQSTGYLVHLIWFMWQKFMSWANKFQLGNKKQMNLKWFRMRDLGWSLGIPVLPLS